MPLSTVPLVPTVSVQRPRSVNAMGGNHEACLSIRLDQGRGARRWSQLPFYLNPLCNPWARVKQMVPERPLEEVSVQRHCCQGPMGSLHLLKVTGQRSVYSEKAASPLLVTVSVNAITCVSGDFATC